MRLLFLLATLAATPALATPSDADLRALAIAGDHAALDQAFAAAHAGVLDGSVPPDDLRAMVSALMVTDPAVRAQVLAWVDARPDSAAALSVGAFIARRDGWALRGSGTFRTSWPDAVIAYEEYQARAAGMALAAYDLDPTFIPASDAVLRLSREGDMPIAVDRVLADVMAITPNRGTLWRAVMTADPSWGGAGLPEVERLCAAYAPLVRDHADYTPDVCIVDMIETELFGRDAYFRANALIEAGLTHPLLARAEITFTSLSSAESYRQYLSTVGQTDTEIAQAYDITFAGPAGLPPLLPEVGARAFADIRERLLVDPYNPDLLRTLRSEMNFDPMSPPPLTAAEERGYALDLAFAAPYDGWSWAWLGSLLGHTGDPELDIRALPFRINAVAYSNHSVSHLWNLSMATLIPARDLLQDGGADALIAQADTLGCPSLRSARLMGAVCSVDPDPFAQEMCDSYHSYADLISDIHGTMLSGGLCVPEIDGPLEGLVYTPVPVDLDAFRDSP